MIEVEEIVMMNVMKNQISFLQITPKYLGLSLSIDQLVQLILINNKVYDLLVKFEAIFLFCYEALINSILKFKYFYFEKKISITFMKS